MFDAPVAEAERQSRDALIDCASRYFDGIELNSAARVPFHAECNRTENGARTASRSDRPDSMGCDAHAWVERGLVSAVASP